MADKLDGNAIIANTIPANRIQTGSITSTQLQTSLYNTVTSATHPKIRSISYPGNDTAANTGGGDTITLTGTGFGNTGNVQIYINGNVVSSITVTNANSISFTAPALAAATYPVYLINTSDGSTAILIPGIQYSGMPSWSTSTPLTSQDATGTWNIQLVATSDSAVSYSLQAGSSLPAGITLAANGLISGTMTSPPSDETTYNFTVVANDLENQDASRAFSVTVTVAVLDPYFTYTTLLLHGDGTNNANNHAFVDSSNNAFAITRNGNASQGTFSPFGDNWSVYFDGNGDYLTVPDSDALEGFSDFTIEFWLFIVSKSNGALITKGANLQTTYAPYVIYFNGSGDLRFLASTTGSSWLVDMPISLSANLPMNQWMHVAVTRSGSTFYTFVNGVLVNSNAAGATALMTNAEVLSIGSSVPTGQIFYFGACYLSNLRILKGTALYTSNFTPPTQPYTSIANTSLLTCQSNAFVDKGPNRFAITRAGDTRVSKFDPFKPYKAIPASYGVYFDGTGDYLTVAANTNWVFSGDYTIEGWLYSTSTTWGLWATGGSGSNDQFVCNSGTLYWDVNVSGGVANFYTSADLNKWVHIAATRSGSTVRVFKNGTQVSTWTSASSIGSNATGYIGRRTDGLYETSGHMSNLRVLKGTALYTSAFTPPTSPLTAIANTSLLTCQSTTIIDNSTNAFTITRNGDAIPTDLNPFTTTFVSEKYNTANGGGAIYCDGSGDYLSMAANSAFSFGTGNFTVEGWVYYGSVASAGFRILATAGVSGDFGVEINNSDQLAFGFAGTSYTCTGGTAKPNAWNHLAVVRSGSTIKGYINGVEVGSTTNAGNITNSQAINFPQTANYSATSGYIASVRYVKGTAVYLSPFVPPTAPVTNIANTSLLCNFTNAGILDSVGKNVLETVGDARINTSVKKYGTGSMYFDGTGDYLKAVATVDNIAYGTGDFTVECWAYFVNAANQQKIFDNYNGNNNPNAALSISNPNANKIQWYSGQTKIVESTSSLSNNTWYHIAVSRTGSTTRLFINGNQEASASDSSSYAIGNGNISIGGEISTGLYSVNGYIDDLRVTKGVARYRYNFTPPTKAFNDGDGNLANNTTDVLVGDSVNLPVFPYTTLLLHGDGTNNANNHAFLDSSNNAFTITRNGNATQGTFSPFSPTGWSGYIDNSSQYISYGSSADFTFGTGDFTVEAWVYVSSVASSNLFSIFNVGSAATGSYSFYVRADGKIESVRYGDSAGSGVTSTAISFNTWNHIAAVRSGGTSRVYINGLADLGSSYSMGSVSASAGETGRVWQSAYTSAGYVSNLRVCKGTAVYTSNFTPTTTLFTSTSQSAANCVLLTLQSSRFVDNNTTVAAKTITISGSPSIQAFSPFAPSVEYTANTHGGSAYFDGTGDYLTAAGSTSLTFGTGDFTVEGWFYTDSPATNRGLFQISTTAGGLEAGNINNIAVYCNSSVLGVYYNDTFKAGTTAIRGSAWTHFALVRSSGTDKLYVNGVVDSGFGSSADTRNYTGGNIAVGGYFSTSYLWNGYISGFRVVKGTAVYTTDFTPPTAPVTAIANTQLLCNFTNAGILDSTGKNVLETVGDARVNTATKKYGTGSMYFDGTGDGLNIRSNDLLTFGTGDYTIECWVYHASVSGQQTYVGDTPGNTNGPYFYKDTNHKVGLYYSSQVLTGSTTIAVNTWYHVAVSRASGTVRLFVNGNQEASASDSTNLSVSIQWIGADNTSNFLNGYMDDLRITKGIARYVTNFTPPTAAFLNK